jgi:D-glycero-alpha-D-manno-heptose-7-phosphate kinase
MACEIEINKLGEPIGKQDQYIASFGGITEFYFRRDGKVDISPLPISTKTLYELEDNLLLFFTGISRSASSILSDQDKKSKVNDSRMIENLHYIKELGMRSREALISGDVYKFGTLMNEHWETKKMRSQGISNEFVNNAYEIAMNSGAVGGKLVGAGGGGFLLFFASNKEKLRTAMSKIGLEEIRFRFDFEGSKVVLS